LVAYNQVHTRLDRMVDIHKQMVEGGLILGVGDTFHRSAEYIRVTVGQLRFTLAELLDDVAGFEAIAQVSQVSAIVKESIQQGVDEGTRILEAMADLSTRCSSLSTPVWTEGIACQYQRIEVIF
jgi:hypothetical protein